MSIWYRISKKSHRTRAFTGEGGLYTTGRWNHRGTKVVYCSSSISLAALEWLSHQGVKTIGTAWIKFSVEIPDEEIVAFDYDVLPKNWDQVPAFQVTRDFATEFLFKPNRLAMKVPSVVIPEEWNLILNPNHSLMPRLKIKDLGENLFHPRLAN